MLLLLGSQNLICENGPFIGGEADINLRDTFYLFHTSISLSFSWMEWQKYCRDQGCLFCWIYLWNINANVSGDSQQNLEEIRELKSNHRERK